MHRKFGFYVAPLRTPTWIVCASLLCIHQALQYGLDIRIPWIDSYLDPILSIPILSGLGQTERRTLAGFGESRGWNWLAGWTAYQWPEFLGLTIAFMVIFEWIFPKVNPLFVSDLWDLPAYALGALMAWFGVNRAASTRLSTRTAFMRTDKCLPPRTAKARIHSR